VTAQGDPSPRPPKLGRYELITRIGQGGMAEVQLALQRGPAGFEKLVVVKLVHENLASQKPFVDMLLDEARVAALVKHPNVVDIYDLGQADGHYFIAMEYLEGEPLLAVLRAGRDGQRLDVLSTARLIADTAEGLDAAHELRSMAGDPIELVHHDVSLGNIVVLYSGQVKLVDFGVAKATQSATARTRVQGKFGYMAPEKLRGGPGDRRSDIWSLGCVLWEALTLRRLFKGGNDPETMQQVLDIPILAPSKVNGDVPADFDPIALRALERDPSKRYPTAKAMAADLEEVLRKRGYAAKNDVIARYMLATFADHIAARKKLLQEVSSKGRASQDVLEAAFSLGTLASGSPLPPANESWPRTPSIERSEMGGGTPAGSAGGAKGKAPRGIDTRTADPGAPPPIAESAARRTLEPAKLPEPNPAPSGRPGHGAGHGAGDEKTEVERPVVDVRRSWTVYAAGAAALVAAVIVVAILIARRGSVAASSSPLFEPESVSAVRTIEPASAARPVDPAAPPAPRPVDPPTAGAAAAAPASAGKPPDVATPHTDDTHGAAPAPASEPSAPADPIARPAKRHPPPQRPAAPARPAAEKINPEELYREGLQAWIHGDGKTGLALCKRVIQANPSFAPPWRVVGLIYEKSGDRTSARNAFEKYLQLAPGAPDAPGIRERLDAL
jgi:eukaryotic-like serine/threonine-protein kinase